MFVADEIGKDIIKILKKYTGLDDKKVIITRASIKTSVDELPEVEVTYYVRSE